jgi:hypothetical protein
MSPLTESTRIVLAKSWDLAGFDADAAAYIQRVEWADTTPLEPATRTAINTFVVGCKADGTWNAIKASCILAGARTLAGALMPLVGAAPTNVNFVSGDYNRKTGLVGNGSTKYLNSNRNNTADPQNNCHLSIYSSALDTANTSAFPTFYMGMTDLLVPSGGSSLGRYQSQSYGRLKDNDLGQVTEAVGMLGISRSSSLSRITRSNRISTSASSNSNLSNSGSMFVFSRNDSGVAALYSNARLAFYSIGESLDLALLDTRVTALITAISTAF